MDEQRRNAPRTGRGNVPLRTPKKYLNSDSPTEKGYRRVESSDLYDIRRDAGARLGRTRGKKKGSPSARGAAGAAASAGYRASRKRDGDGDVTNNYGYSAGERRAAARAKRREAEREKQRWLIFGCCMVVYVLILAILSICFLNYTGKCLKKYEASQSVYAMQEYFDSYCMALKSGQLPEDVDLKDYVNAYDTLANVESRFIAEMQNAELTYEKARDSYDTENPVYVIYADGAELSRVTLEGYDGEVILAILTILNWRVKSVETTYYLPDTHDYAITVPEDYAVLINGEPISEEYFTGEYEDTDIFSYVSEYTGIHGRKNYLIPDVGVELDIRITDSGGNDVTPEVDNYTYTVDYERGTAMPEELSAYALTAAESWGLMMILDLPGDCNGFYNLAQYLIFDSYYYNMAYEFATGTDITFVSPHTLKDPAITDVVVDDYVRYCENCFSCHIAYNVQMVLTLNGVDAVNATDSHYMFVNYDDSDDGEDNPHWAIVDMY